ncbi:hypothetical protein Ctob_010882, partial [Chrysochromulina tobinii]
MPSSIAFELSVFPSHLFSVALDMRRRACRHLSPPSPPSSPLPTPYRRRRAHARARRTRDRRALVVARLAEPRCNDSRSAVQALRTARVSQVRRTRVCERVLKNAF